MAEKIGKEGWGQERIENKNKEAKAVRGGFGDWRMDERSRKKRKNCSWSTRVYIELFLWKEKQLEIIGCIRM